MIHTTQANLVTQPIPNNQQIPQKYKQLPQYHQLKNNLQSKIQHLKFKNTTQIRSQSTAILPPNHPNHHKQVNPFQLKQQTQKVSLMTSKKFNIRKSKSTQFTKKKQILDPQQQQQIFQKIKIKQKPVYNVILQLNIKPPQPKVKFYEFVSMPPFNRISLHYQYIQHFMRQYNFFKMHPQSIVNFISKKVILQDKLPFTNSNLWIVENGYIIIKGIKYEKGQIANRQLLDKQIFQYQQNYNVSEQCRIFSIAKYDYQSFISTYLATNFPEFNKFFRKIPIFQKFPELSIQTLLNSLNAKFLLKKQIVYKVGDEIDNLYIVYSGNVFRKVIVQLDKTNKIPVQLSQYLIRTYYKSYQFKIIMSPGQIFGFRQLINGQKYRNQTIEVQQNSLLLCINLNVLNEVLDEHLIEKLKSYNKYPQNYSKLCEILNDKKERFKQSQMLKIKALRQNCKNGNDIYKKNSRLSNLIERSLKKIKQNEKLAYLKTRKNQQYIRHL